MFGLIVRDLMVQRKRLWLAVLYCALFPLLFKGMGQASLVVVMVATVYIMLLNAFAYDDKYKIDSTMVSLPISRKTLVIARYLEVPFLSFAAVLLYMLVTALMAPLVPGLFPTQWLLPAAGFFAASLMSGLYLPIIYKLGYVKARIFNMVIFMIFFALIPIVGAAGDDTKWGAGISAWLATASEGTVAALIVAAAAAVLAVSCMISVRMFRKRSL